MTCFPQVLRRLAVVLLAAGCCVSAAAAAEFKGESDVHYRACLSMAGSKPDEAFEAALGWRDRGGGFPARHCMAVALINLRQYVDAADRLEKLALDMQKVGSPLQSDVLGQAGNAWMLASQYERARGVFSAALRIEPNNPDHLIDRARTAAALGDLRAAIDDLDRAIAIEPGRAESYAFRASARRQMNDRPGAMADLAEALKRDPNDVEALLERGILRAAEGDLRGARADWLKVATDAAGTPAGDAAQRNLEQVDVKQR